MLTQEQVAALLDEAETKWQRALVLITTENSRSITELTSAVREMVNGQTMNQTRLEKIDTALSRHITEEGQLLSAGVRLFGIISSLLALVITVGGWYVGHHIITVNEMQQSVIDKSANRITALEVEMITHWKNGQPRRGEDTR